MPSTVGTATRGDATAGYGQRHQLIASDGTAFVCAFDGSNLFFATASSPYTSWSGKTTIVAAGGVYAPSTGGFFATYGCCFNGSATDSISVYYVDSNSTRRLHHVLLTRSGSTWTVGTNTVVEADGDQYGANNPAWIGTDSTGRLWIVGWRFAGSGVFQIAARWANAPFTTWTLIATPSTPNASFTNLELGGAIGIVGNSLCTFYTNGTALYGITLPFSAMVWNAETLYDAGSGATSGYWATPAMALSGTSSDGMLVGSYSGATSGFYPWAYHYNPTTDSFDSFTTFGTTYQDLYPAVCTDGTNFYAIRSAYAAANNYAIVYRKWTQSTTTWDSSDTTISPSGTNQVWTSAHGANSTTLVLTWTQGTASPWNVEFAAVAVGGTPATVAVSPIALTLSPQSAAASGAAAVAASAISLSLSPQAPAVSGAATVATTAIALNLAPQAPAVSGAATIAATTIALTLAPQAPAATGAASLPLGAIPLALSPQATTPSGAATINLSATSLTLAPQTATATAGSGASVAITPISLTLAPQSPAVSGAAEIGVSAISLTLASQTVTTGGGATVTMTPIALALTPQNAAPSGAAAIALNAVPLTLTPQSPTSSGAAAVNLSAISLILTPQTATAGSGVVVAITPIALTLAPQGAAAAGAAALTIDPIALGLSPQALEATGAATVSAVAITLVFTPQTVTAGIATGILVVSGTVTAQAAYGGSVSSAPVLSGAVTAST